MIFLCCHIKIKLLIHRISIPCGIILTLTSFDFLFSLGRLLKFHQAHDSCTLCLFVFILLLKQYSLNAILIGLMFFSIHKETNEINWIDFKVYHVVIQCIKYMSCDSA